MVPPARGWHSCWSQVPCRGFVVKLAVRRYRQAHNDAPVTESATTPGRKRAAMTRFTVRLRQLEARARSGSKSKLGCGEIWIQLKDGRMRGEGGKILSPEEFEQRRPRADTVLILPDNGRDEPLPIRRTSSVIDRCHCMRLLQLRMPVHF